MCRASAGFSISLSQAYMTVIAVDGGNAVAPDTPSATSIGLLYPGERIEILVERSPKKEAAAVGMQGSKIKKESEEESRLTIVLDQEYVLTSQEEYKYWLIAKPGTSS
jgi:hypothetical protein